MTSDFSKTSACNVYYVYKPCITYSLRPIGVLFKTDSPTLGCPWAVYNKYIIRITSTWRILATRTYGLELRFYATCIHISSNKKYCCLNCKQHFVLQNVHINYKKRLTSECVQQTCSCLHGTCGCACDVYSIITIHIQLFLPDV